MIKSKTTACLFLLLASISLCGCDRNDGPAEKAGRAIDNTVDKAGKAVERAGEKMQGK